MTHRAHTRALRRSILPFQSVLTCNFDVVPRGAGR